MMVNIARNPVAVSVLLCAVLLCSWAVFSGTRHPAADRRVTNLAVSASGRWMAAGTARGKITVWDETQPDTPWQIAFPHGSLNDLSFSPDGQASRFGMTTRLSRRNTKHMRIRQPN